MPKSQYKIFISYAQNDVVYFNLLKDGLDNHTKHSKNLLWEVWDNTQVRPGENWHEVIQEKITGCDCVILLISSNFLYSEYIEKQEFGRFIQRQESDGLLVFPILLEPCDFTQWTYLRDRQLFIPNGSKYGLPEIEQLSYAHLVAFDKNGRVLPNPFREEYHIELVKIFEATLSEFSSKNQALSLDKKSVDNKTQQENLPLAFKAYLEKVKDFEPIDASEDELREFTNIGNQLASVFMSSFDRITKKIMDSEHLKELYLDVHFEEIAYSEKLGLITEKVIEVKFKDRNKYPYWERSQIVSALTLSLIYQFDENKVKWLLNFVRSKEDFVWKRALIGLFVGLMNNEKHIKGYLQQELNQLKSDYEIQECLFEINENLQNPLGGIEINPYDQDPELLQIMQQNGIYLDYASIPRELSSSTFASAVKFFDCFEFFDKPQNWFLPFYQGNPVVKEKINDELYQFLLFASNSWTSDAIKYAFCLNIANFPPTTVSIVSKILSKEIQLTQLEFQKDLNMVLKYPDTEAFYAIKKEMEIGNYISELHFFLNHFSQDKFQNIFKEKIDFFNTDLVEFVISEQNKLKKDAEIAYLNGDYELASKKFEMYLKIVPEDYPSTQKLAFSLSSCQKFAEAKTVLQTLILRDPEEPWNQNQMLYMFNRLKLFKEGIEYAKTIYDKFNTNTIFLSNLADLHYELQEYRSAIKIRMTIYQMKRNEPHNLFSLGWLFFITSDLENAKRAFFNHIEIVPNPFFTAFQNLGHIHLCLGEIEDCKKMYEQSLIAIGEDVEEFVDGCDEDFMYIEKHGIQKEYFDQIIQLAVKNHLKRLSDIKEQ